MSQNELEILKILKAANGSTVKAENLKTQTRLSDTDLQSAVSGLTSRGFADVIDGSELEGKPLRFHDAWITDSGNAAL